MKKILRKDILTSIIIIVVAVAFSVGLVAFSRSGFKFRNPDNVTVATVNGNKITKGEYDKIYLQLLKSQGQDASTVNEQEAKSIKESAIDVLVTRELVKQLGSELEVPVSDSDVKERIEEIKASFPTEEDFQNALKTGDINESELNEIVRIDLISNVLIVEKVNPSQFKASEEEIKKMYDDVFYDNDAPEFSTVEAQIESLISQQKAKDAIDAFMEDLKALQKSKY